MVVGWRGGGGGVGGGVGSGRGVAAGGILMCHCDIMHTYCTGGGLLELQLLIAGASVVLVRLVQRRTVHGEALAGPRYRR